MVCLAMAAADAFRIQLKGHYELKFGTVDESAVQRTEFLQGEVGIPPSRWRRKGCSGAPP
jgi:hypothetical protein